VINGKDVTDLTAEILRISGGGLHNAFDTTGVPALINAGIDALRPLGALAFCAAMKGKTFDVSLTIRTDSRKLIGVTEGDSNYPLFLPQLVEFHKKGLLPFDKLVKYYPLDEIGRAFEDALSGKIIKPIIRF
jgi:aryl-alcohol dehydrogenase